MNHAGVGWESEPRVDAKWMSTREEITFLRDSRRVDLKESGR